MKTKLLIVVLGLITTFCFSQSNNCDGISKKVDEFDGKITFRADVTPLYGENLISYMKIKRSDDVKYYLSIYIRESDIYTGTGVYLILGNGEKIVKPNEKVDYTLISNHFYTRALIQLTDDDIKLLKESGLKKFKIYISTGELSDILSEKSKALINCLIISE